MRKSGSPVTATWGGSEVSSAGDRYNQIGCSYAETRTEDPRIAREIWDCLGPGRTVLNVGAGTGSYEPPDREVIALEPSVAMIRQRKGTAAPTVRGVAESLPFPDGSFDAAMAVLTMHHWSDASAGIREMRRVADRQLVLYFEPLKIRGFWGLEYFPEAVDLDVGTDPPGEDLLRQLLRVRTVRPLLVPRDCRDGFGTAYWARPEAYLEPEVQAGMSWLALLAKPARQSGTRRLREDLASGEWDRRHGHLRTQLTFDGGYRIAIAG